MTMTSPILERCIQCPNCEKKTMRKALGSKALWIDMTGREYFCDQCHLYYGINELVNNWNYDLGDFGDCMELTIDDFVSIGFAIAKREEKNLLKEVEEPVYKVDEVPPSWLLGWWETDTVSINDEGDLWLGVKYRDMCYETVTRMFLGIPEWDDELVDTGALHV